MKKIFILLLIFLSSDFVHAQQSVGEAVNGTSGTLTVTFTTTSAGGNRSPMNVIAIWVQNSSNVLVNTLMYYTSNGHTSALDMSTWWGLIGSHWSGNAVTIAGYTKTDADALNGRTGATLQGHATRTCYWGKTVNIATIADGTYTVGMELADADGLPPVNSTGHKLVKYTFAKGTSSSTGVLSGSAQSSFSNVSVQWVSAVSAINDVKLEKLYSVYPNPTKSDIYVSGTDIESVQILSLDGRSMFFTKDQKLNVSQLKAGTYLAYITTAKGSFSKKIIKE